MTRRLSDSVTHFYYFFNGWYVEQVPFLSKWYIKGGKELSSPSPPPPTHTLICIPFDLQANEAQLKETSSSLSSSN